MDRPCECGHDYREHARRGSRPCDHNANDPAEYCQCEQFEDALSYGEAGTLAQLTQFLGWMRTESCPVPETKDECGALLKRWLRHHRAEEARMVRFLTRGTLQ
jgi:hypothetical protein